jgi:hypothetical protein
MRDSKSKQNDKEIYLCLFSFVTGVALGVTVAMWPELHTVVRVVFIFFTCLLAAMTYAFKTAKITEDKTEAKQ